MKKLNLNIQLLENSVSEPEYGSSEAAGLDLKAGIKNQINFKDIKAVESYLNTLMLTCQF